MPTQKKSSDGVRVAVITLIGVLITGIITLIVNSNSDIDKIIQATQAAETKLTTNAALTPATPLIISSPSSISQFINTTEPNSTETLALSSNNTSGCNTEFADTMFKYALSQSNNLTVALGSRMSPKPICIWSSYQSFEGGEMIWRSDSPTEIYVLSKSGTWKSFNNKYKSGSPIASCLADPPQKNQLQPLLGFGKVWCDNQIVKEELGYAFIGESAIERAVQTFENGWMVLINQTIYVVYYDDGRWDSIESFNYRQISLRAESELSIEESNLGLGQGIVKLPGMPWSLIDPVSGKFLVIPFDVGWKATTQCAYLPNRPQKIEVLTNIQNPLRVYLLIQAGWGVKSYEGKTIGSVLLNFDSEHVIVTPLILGFNIRDWADRPIAITTVASPYTQTAWEGTDSSGIPGRMDILIIDIPNMYSTLILKNIQVEDESLINTGSMDPCIHLLAITVSYLP